ncbi:hypothetical protein evm_010348 [Chilo suppressalis]|nr:hypothetical protein evm_010348 [Chilo suppressalis]
MGVAISKYSEISSNELLARFCSDEVLCPNEPFWNQMLAFNINPPANAEEQLIFDSSSEALLQKFLQNNLQTGNLGSLVQVFITRATELLATPNSDNHHHHHQPINVPTAGAQAFPMDGIGRLGHDPPRGPSADLWVLTTADAAGTNGLTCLPKHGGT